CWIALTDATVDNGCPWVVPGVHRMGTLAHWMNDLGWQCLEAPDEAVAVPVRAGSIVVLSSLTPHTTGPNLTASVRKAYILQLAPARPPVIRDVGATHQAPAAGRPLPRLSEGGPWSD